MKKSGLPPIAWGLAGLLCIAAMLISLGQQETKAKPEVGSVSPSGISILTELLRKNGTQVEVDQEQKPRLGPNDVAVSFEPISAHEFGADQVQAGGDSKFRDNFWNTIKAGGKGIVLPIQSDFLESSRATNLVTVKDEGSGDSFKISSSGDFQDKVVAVSPIDDCPALTLWRAGAAPFLRAYRVEKGSVLVASDGIGVTNRFIDKGDNAKAFATMLSIFAGKNSRLVFTEASFGNIHEKGILETIGPWANAAWQQLLFLGLVVVFTLGKRFGLPDERRPTQRSTRELVDAISDTFLRSRSTHLALATSWDRADADIRAALKLPKDATRAERDRLLPVNLQNSLARLEAARQLNRVPQEEALDLVRRAQTELDTFLAPHRAKLASLAKLKK